MGEHEASWLARRGSSWRSTTRTSTTSSPDEPISWPGPRSRPRCCTSRTAPGSRTCSRLPGASMPSVGTSPGHSRSTWASARFLSQTHVMAGLWSAEVIHAVRLRRASFLALCPDSDERLRSWLRGEPPVRGNSSTFVLLDPLAQGRQARTVGTGPRALGRAATRARIRRGGAGAATRPALSNVVFAVIAHAPAQRNDAVLGQEPKSPDPAAWPRPASSSAVSARGPPSGACSSVSSRACIDCERTRRWPRGGSTTPGRLATSSLEPPRIAVAPVSCAEGPQHSDRLRGIDGVVARRRGVRIDRGG